MAPSIADPKISFEISNFKRPDAVYTGKSPYAEKVNEGPSVLKESPNPLKASGALDKRYEFSEVTPIIGREYKDAQLSELLKDDDLVRDLAITISRRGVVVFRDQDISVAEQKELAEKLGRFTGRPETNGLHIHPIIGAGGVISDDNPDEIDPEVSLISTKIQNALYKPPPSLLWQKPPIGGWHSDITFEPAPSDYSSLKILETPETGGDTLWASGYALYEKVSPPIRQLLESLTGTYSQPVFEKDAKSKSYDLFTGPRGAPENTGDSLSAVHPLVRTNPVTGWKSVFALGVHFTNINGVSKKESDLLKKYIEDLLVDNHDIQVRFKWKKNDIAIWDNRSSYHTATIDYTGERSGVRTVGVGERPYLDKDSKARSEDLAATGATW